MAIILELKNLTVEYESIKGSHTNKVTAVNNVSFKLREGEIYALAGESGCGKSTTAKAIMRLIQAKSGDILLHEKSIYDFSKADLKEYPKKIQMVFQNPYSSLNPKMKIKDILQEPLDINTTLSKKEKLNKICTAIEEVGLPETCLNLYPHEFSGGQRQRIAIAKALILNPQILIADEPVSALDASIQAQILNLLKELKQKHNLTILFISHDMNVIQYLADRIGIMYCGQLIEENYTSTVFRLPKENYTKQLLSAVPQIR